MKIHEYQAKEILRKFKVAVPEGKVAYSVEEAVEITLRETGEELVEKTIKVTAEEIDNTFDGDQHQPEQQK